MHEEPCWLCGEDPATIIQTNSRRVLIECPCCGNFGMTFEAAEAWGKSYTRLTLRQVANIRGWVREHQGVHLYEDDLKTLLELPAPSVLERADKLLVGIERVYDSVGEPIPLHASSPHFLKLQAISYSASAKELGYLGDTCLSDGLGYLKPLRSPVGELLSATITASGYSHLEDLRKSRGNGSLGFCAMWFDKRVEPLWHHAIEPAIRMAGYAPKRIDKHEHNNRIDDEIVALIRRSRFVVADYTGNRGGVYFEAGFAKGLDIPVIWTCREQRLHRVHFDTRQYNFITWHENDIATFAERLQNRIEATIGRGPLNNT